MRMSAIKAQSTIKQILREEQSKLAALPATDQSYERIIVRVGTAMLNEHLPQILPYMVGSKFLHRSDDGTFVAAFFVFDISGLIVDIPVFLINGSVKGYELLYVRDSKIFLPSMPEVLDFLKLQQEEKVGEPSINEGANRLRRAGVNNSIYSSNSRYMSSAKAAGYAEELLDGAVGAFKDIMEANDPKLASLPEDYDWMLLLNSRSVRDQARKLAAVSPAFTVKMASLLGEPEWVSKLNQCDDDIAALNKAASIATSSNLSKRRFIGVSPESAPKHLRIDGIGASAKIAGAWEAHKEHSAYGAYFVDTRPVTKVAYMVSRPATYGTPTATGTCKVLTIDGTERTVFVFLRDSVRSYDDTSVATIIDAETNSLAKIYTHEIAADLSDDSAVVSDYGKGLYARDLPKLNSSVTLNKPLVALFPDGTIYGPFEVTSVGDEPAGVLRIYNNHVAPQGKHMGIGNDCSGSSSFSVRQLVVSDKLRNAPKVMELGDRETMFVPEDTKIIYVGTADSEKCCSSVNNLDLLPCSQFEAQEMLKKAAFTLQRASGPFCRFNGETKLKADVIDKIASIGLTVSQCKELVDSDLPGTRSYLVADKDAKLPEVVAGRKLAFTLTSKDMYDEYQFGTPSEAPEGIGGNQILVRETLSNVERLPSQSMQYADRSQGPWSSYNSPYTEPVVGRGGDGEDSRGSDKEANDIINNPERLFENAAFLNMINYVNPAVEREKLIESCIKSCTGVGRSYFLLLVHGDEFAEAYGLGDADELAGKLLTQLQGAGKILITLFSRSISAGSDLSLSALNPG